MAKKGQVRQVEPAQGVERSADDERQQFRAQKTQTDGEQAQPGVVRTLQKLTAIIWRLLFHELIG